MKHKDNSPVSILMALANNTRYPILLSALHLLGRFLYNNSLERVHGLSRQFRDMLEHSLMETVQTYLAAQPDDDDRTLLLGDWKQLSCHIISHPFENPLSDELETDIAVLNCVGDYVSQRETIMARLAELPEGTQYHVRSCLRSKLTELLFYAVIPQFSGKHADLSAHRFRLWVELNNCIAAGAEGYAMSFLCHDGHALRVLSPWTLTCEASAAQWYQTA